MREKLVLEQIIAIQSRITPAYAGKTTSNGGALCGV